MAYTTRILVVANVTASSPDLVDALVARAERGPIAATLLMPASAPGVRGREESQPALDAAVAAWRERGLEADGVVGETDPVEAVQEVWSPAKFDEVIVSTLPGATSKWLAFDFPHRVARITDVPVMHVVARPPGWNSPEGGPLPEREKNPLGRLAVLSWGGGRRR